MPRFFTLTEAEKLLPEMERLLQSCTHAKRDYDRAESLLVRVAHQIELAGGMLPPRERIANARQLKDASARQLKAAVDRIGEVGCQLKDLEMGLVDFPTLYKDKEVYLCWKLGESGIRFWHHVEDGFRGRRPIDEEFVANHRGDSGGSTRV
jgi:hypothetical protein